MVRCPYCDNETDFLTTKQVGELLGRDDATIRSKIKQGHFPGAIEVKGIHSRGMWRIPTSAVLPLLNRGEGE